MDFGKVLDTVAEFLDEGEYRYSLVGAFALSACGLSRATQDLDFAVEARAQDELVSFLEALGYETIYRSQGYSNHVHPLADLGRVDFVYVFEPTATNFFAHSRSIKFLERDILVPKPEHLAAMKVLAMKNDPSRTFRELADIQFLLTLPGVNRDEVRQHFAHHDLMERFDELIEILEKS